MSEQYLLPLFDEPEPPGPLVTDGVTLVCDDVLAWAQNYTGPKFHAMLTDAPYHLTEKGSFSTGEHYGAPRSEDDKTRRRLSRTGFMGKDWDGGDIAFKPDTWKALAQHLLPGAFGMCFASSRGWHRLACAIEDAGLIIHPSIFGWGFSQGFPKASRIDTQVDRANGREFEDRYALGAYLKQRRQSLDVSEDEVNNWLGATRKCAHYESTSPGFARVPTPEDWMILKSCLKLDNRFDALIDRVGAEREVIGKGDAGLGKRHPAHNGGYEPDYNLTAPATPLAQAWAEHRYGLQALKPALEPIIVFQKPYQGRSVQSIVQHGAGALWIDGARVGVGEQWWERGDAPPDAATALMQGVHGRWPSNFALCHTDQCVRVGEQQVKSESGGNVATHHKGKQGYGGNSRDFVTIGHKDANGNETVAAWQCAPGCPVAALDLQAGERKPPWGKGVSISRTKSWKQSSAERIADHGKYQDGSNASRFFATMDWSLDIAERLAQADPAFYCAKASRGERDTGLEGEVQRRTTAYGQIKVRTCRVCGSRRNDGMPYPTSPSCGHDDWSWQDVTAEGSRGGSARNPHPTVKPLKLTQWLATLLLPPAAYAPRRLLIPFAGTASEGIGAMLAGWEEIVMIEQDHGYVDIAKARVDYWKEHRL
jgi:hypothetical protein